MDSYSMQWGIIHYYHYLLWWSVVSTVTRGRALRAPRIVLIKYGRTRRYGRACHEMRHLLFSLIPRNRRICSPGEAPGLVTRPRKWGENGGGFIIISTGRNGWAVRAGLGSAGLIVSAALGPWGRPSFSGTWPWLIKAGEERPESESPIEDVVGIWAPKWLVCIWKAGSGVVTDGL